VAAQLAGPVGAPFASVVGLGQRVPLDHRAHRAVEDEDAVGERGLQGCGGVGAVVLVVLGHCCGPWYGDGSVWRGCQVTGMPSPRTSWQACRQRADPPTIAPFWWDQ